MVARYDYTERELKRVGTLTLGRWYVELQLELAYQTKKAKKRVAATNQLGLITTVLSQRTFDRRLNLRDRLEDLFSTCVPLKATEREKTWSLILMEYQRDVLD